MKAKETRKLLTILKTGIKYQPCGLETSICKEELEELERLAEIGKALEWAMKDDYNLVRVDGFDTITNLTSLVRVYKEATDEN